VRGWRFLWISPPIVGVLTGNTEVIPVTLTAHYFQLAEKLANRDARGSILAAVADHCSSSGQESERD
jgi:hypothetical protein